MSEPKYSRRTGVLARDVRKGDIVTVTPNETNTQQWYTVTDDPRYNERASIWKWQIQCGKFHNFVLRDEDRVDLLRPLDEPVLVPATTKPKRKGTARPYALMASHAHENYHRFIASFSTAEKAIERGRKLLRNPPSQIFPEVHAVVESPGEDGFSMKLHWEGMVPHSKVTGGGLVTIPDGVERIERDA